MDEAFWYAAAKVVLIAAMYLVLRKLVRVVGYLPLARLGVRFRQAPVEYLRALFDGYAEDYDQHLLVKLDYQGANRVSSALNDYRAVTGSSPGRCLDLGCGTGALGVLIAPRVTRLIGVDLSPGMIEEAARRRVYDELHEAEIVRFLERDPNSYALITAADVVVYLGALDALFKVLVPRLEAGGAFIFTTEDAPDGDTVCLMPTGRFGHSAAYVADTAWSAGLTVWSQSAAVLRKQEDEPVCGHVHILVKR